MNYTVERLCNQVFLYWKQVISFLFVQSGLHIQVLPLYYYISLCIHLLKLRWYLN